MSGHVQALVFYPAYHKSIEVDVGILPLLRNLWDAEILTCNSCEEIEPGIMWIEFYSEEDVEKFLLILIEALGEQIHNHPEADDWFCFRILGCDGEILRPWQYYAHPNITPAKCDQSNFYPKKLKNCKVALSFSLRFPKEDYSKVLTLLHSYLYRSKEYKHLELLRTSQQISRWNSLLKNEKIYKLIVWLRANRG
jgi:hypothetical protein